MASGCRSSMRGAARKLASTREDSAPTGSEAKNVEDSVADEGIPAFLKLLQAALQDRLQGRKGEAHPSAREDSPFQVARTLARLAWTKKRHGSNR